MIKKEFQKIWANKLLFVTVIVAMCLPILYASIFLKSIWDPYGRINHLPVAVVNLDQPTTLEGNKVDVGDRLVKELKSNDDLDWHFVSAKKAQEGLKDRKYYMIVKIPKNFSENAASVLDTDPEKMDLTYETNGGLNFLGEVISENAMTQLKAQVSESVTKSYADVIIKMVKTVGDGMEQAADGATKLADGSKQVADGIATVQGKVPELSSGVKQLDDGGKQLADGVKQYTDGAGQAAKGSDQLAAGLQQLNGKVPTLVGGVNQLADGGKALNTGVNQYTAGVKQAYLGSNQLVDGLKVLSYKVPGLVDGVNKLVGGGNQFVDGLNAYTAGVAQLKDGSATLSKGMTALNDKVPTLANGINQLADGGQGLQAGISAYTAGVKAANAGNSQVTEGLTSLNAQLPTLVSSIQKLSKGSEELSSKLNGSDANFDKLLEYTAGVNSFIAEIQKLPVDQIAGLQPQLTAMSQGLTQLSNSLDSSQMLASIDQLPVDENGHIAVTKDQLKGMLASNGNAQQAQAIIQQMQTQIANVSAMLSQANLSDLGPKLNQFSTATNQVSSQVKAAKVGQQQTIAAVNQISAGLNQLNQATPTVTGGVSALVKGSTELGQGLNKLEENSPKLTGGAAELNGGIKQVKDKLPALKEGSAALTKGAKDLDSGLATLNSKSGELTGGANQLVGGMKAMQSQLPTLTDGVKQLVAGGSQLNGGLNLLNAKSVDLNSGSGQLAAGLGLMQRQLPALASGANQLADGSKQLNAGMKKLTANSAKLNSGASQLSDGLNTLNGQIPALADGVNKLADGSTQVKDGNKELADKLGEASDKLTDVKLTNNTAKMIADPTKTKQEKYSDVPNYGHALAPYFMSVSLFVGCLVFNFVYPIRKIADRKNSNATQWFMSKLTVGFITSSMMALIIGTVMRMIGLEVAQPMNFYMTLLVTAWLFMFMIMFLAMSFDNPGRFIAVLFLVMQLGSSGGVFPMPLISKFYNVLNPFMPMTYSIYSLRQAISTGLGDELYRNSMLILVILAIVFIILLGVAMQILYRKGLAGYSQLHENQKLLDDDYTGKFAKEEDPYTLW